MNLKDKLVKLDNVNEMFASDLQMGQIVRVGKHAANLNGYLSLKEVFVAPLPLPPPKTLMDVVTKQSPDTETKLADLQPHPYPTHPTRKCFPRHRDSLSPIVDSFDF